VLRHEPNRNLSIRHSRFAFVLFSELRSGWFPGKCRFLRAEAASEWQEARGLASFGSAQGRLWSRALPKAHERGRSRLHQQPSAGGRLAPTSTTVRRRGRPRHTRRGPGRGV